MVWTDERYRRCQFSNFGVAVRWKIMWTILATLAVGVSRIDGRLVRGAGPRAEIEPLILGIFTTQWKQKYTERED